MIDKYFCDLHERSMSVKKGSRVRRPNHGEWLDKLTYRYCLGRGWVVKEQFFLSPRHKAFVLAADKAKETSHTSTNHNSQADRIGDEAS